jgi:hypothetical protein
MNNYYPLLKSKYPLLYVDVTVPTNPFRHAEAYRLPVPHLDEGIQEILSLLHLSVGITPFIIFVPKASYKKCIDEGKLVRVSYSDLRIMNITNNFLFVPVHMCTWYQTCVLFKCREIPLGGDILCNYRRICNRVVQPLLWRVWWFREESFITNEMVFVS